MAALNFSAKLYILDVNEQVFVDDSETEEEGIS